MSIYIKVRNHSRVGSCHFGDTWKSAVLPILEETIDIISFMWVHWDTRENIRGHHEMGVVLEDVLVQIPFPKHLFTPRTPYGHIRTGFWRFRIFPVYRLPSTFVRWYPGPVGFCLLDQLTIVRWLRIFGLKPHKTPIHGTWSWRSIKRWQTNQVGSG